MRVHTVDYHTAGEPFRIVTGGMPTLRGATVVAKRADARARLDGYRRLLVREPRGHDDMYGGFITAPDDDGADLGVVFWHSDGYSTACGHGTIALGVWAVESGLVTPIGGEAEVMIDVPSGRVSAFVQLGEQGRPQAARFRNVPAFVLAEGLAITTAAGELVVDVSFGGATYVSVDAQALDIPVTPANVRRFVELAGEVRATVNGLGAADHPASSHLDGVYGVMFVEDHGTNDEGELEQRSITVFADGQVDRSPCGSGTSARLALLSESGTLASGQVLRHTSIIGTQFTSRVVEPVSVHGRRGVVTEITGSAHPTGRHEFVLDAADEVGLGFSLTRD